MRWRQRGAERERERGRETKTQQGPRIRQEASIGNNEYYEDETTAMKRET